MFGVELVIPNIHMHLYLADCLQDRGHLHSFGLYSFKRCNGLLGKQPTNNRTIDLQMLREKQIFFYLLNFFIFHAKCIIKQKFTSGIFASTTPTPRLIALLI